MDNSGIRTDLPHPGSWAVNNRNGLQLSVLEEIFPEATLSKEYGCRSFSKGGFPGRVARYTTGHLVKFEFANKQQISY